mmetsp:Transcript_6131/g.23180  ORF Transcript_6131/g.23180 Transcript_6131/m.23180 type:complete len:125 (-) Transcript_6131:296-670(-)
MHQLSWILGHFPRGLAKQWKTMKYIELKTGNEFLKVNPFFFLVLQLLEPLQPVDLTLDHLVNHDDCVNSRQILSSWISMTNFRELVEQRSEILAHTLKIQVTQFVRNGHFFNSEKFVHLWKPPF